MTRRKYGRKSKKTESDNREDDCNQKLALKLADSAKETAVGLESKLKNQPTEVLSTFDMANLETILRELRDFRQENSDTLKEIKEEIKLPTAGSITQKSG